MTLEQYLSTLADETQPLRHAEMLRLSSLTQEEMNLLKRQWRNVEAGRRQGVLTRLVEIAEDNLDADFNGLFVFCLADEDAFVRAKAIEGLWECDDRTLVTPFTGMLRDDPSEKVRAAAALALGNFAVLAQNGKMLEKDGERILETLIRTINATGEVQDVRRRAIEAVAPFGTSQVQQMIQAAYDSGQLEVRYSAVYAMGKSCDPYWLPVILKELKSSDPAMRYEASNACGEMGEEHVVPHLISLFKDEDDQTQASAIAAVGAIGGSLARRALMSCLKSSDDHVVEAAQEALTALQATDGDEEFGLGLHSS